MFPVTWKNVYRDFRHDLRLKYDSFYFICPWLELELLFIFYNAGDKDPDGCLFPQSSIPAHFLSQHTQCVTMFKDYQMLAIRRNLDLFNGTGCHGYVESNISVANDDEQSRKSSEEDRIVENINGEEEENSLRNGQSEIGSRSQQKCTEGQSSLLELEKEYCMECFLMKYNVKPLASHARIMRNVKVYESNTYSTFCLSSS